MTFAPLCTIYCHISIRWIHMDIQYILFFFCPCHIVSISNDVIIFVWIKKRTYVCLSAPKEFLRRRKCHVLQNLLLKTLCSSSWLLFLETDSRSGTLAMWLTHLPADKLPVTRFPPPLPFVPVGVKKLCEKQTYFKQSNPSDKTKR